MLRWMGHMVRIRKKIIPFRVLIGNNLKRDLEFDETDYKSSDVQDVVFEKTFKEFGKRWLWWP